MSDTQEIARSVVSRLSASGAVRSVEIEQREHDLIFTLTPISPDRFTERALRFCLNLHDREPQARKSSLFLWFSAFAEVIDQQCYRVTLYNAGQVGRAACEVFTDLLILALKSSQIQQPAHSV